MDEKNLRHQLETVNQQSGIPILRIFPRHVHLEIETRSLVNSTDNGNEVDEVIVSGN